MSGGTPIRWSEATVEQSVRCPKARKLTARRPSKGAQPSQTERRHAVGTCLAVGVLGGPPAPGDHVARATGGRLPRRRRCAPLERGAWSGDHGRRALGERPTLSVSECSPSPPPGGAAHPPHCALTPCAAPLGLRSSAEVPFRAQKYKFWRKGHQLTLVRHRRSLGTQSPLERRAATSHESASSPHASGALASIPLGRRHRTTAQTSSLSYCMVFWAWSWYRRSVASVLLCRARSARPARPRHAAPRTRTPANFECSNFSSWSAQLAGRKQRAAN